MRLCGLTEWLLMELQKLLLMNWFMGIMLFCPRRYNQIRGEFAKGLKFQKLQWLNDGRVRGFAYDSS
jgi:hypothetical protein